MCPNLVAYFNFNGDANDRSGFQNTASTYYVSLAPDKYGNIDSSYYFNCNPFNYIELPKAIMNGKTDFSIAMWVKSIGTTN